MLKSILTLCIGLLLNLPLANANDLKIHFLPLYYGHKTLNLRIGIQSPTGDVAGDILYLHGFADRLDNHQPLFRAWTEAGFRVIAFDLPSHGENSGNYNNLNNFSFEDLAVLTAKVEENTQEDSHRPLLLSGWSTGGLIVVRMLQEQWTSGLSRPVSGAILFAPGVSVRKFPWTFGNRLGLVTQESLTHTPHPPHVAAVQPDSPFWNHLIFQFSPRLVAESIISQHRDYPADIPTLVFTAGEAEDMYAKEGVIHSWIQQQNHLRQTSHNSPIVDISCPHARHELDNEDMSYGALEVQKSASAFAHSIITGKQEEFAAGKETFGNICGSH
ncbi:MAG: alpha/beta hydrolase [Pseudobdellovibrionaceae bacterium]